MSRSSTTPTPARTTIAGEDNDPPLLVAVGIVTLVLGGVGLPIDLGCGWAAAGSTASWPETVDHLLPRTTFG